MPEEFEELSIDFLAWLVQKRSENQISTLKLYRIIQDVDNKAPFETFPFLFTAAQELTAVAFSLWRSVFLNDLSNKYEDESADLEKFLKNLIAHNSIQYMTDFNSREWSFWYYVNNATARLKVFNADIMPGIVPEDLMDRQGSSAKERWETSQMAFDQAVDSFGRAVIAKR